MQSIACPMPLGARLSLSHSTGSRFVLSYSSHMNI